MTKTSEINFYAASGMAAMIPGFQKAIDFLQTELDAMKGQLTALQTTKPVAKWWSADPAERSREMRRRQAKRKAKTAVPTVKLAGHPRDVGHPDHERFIAKIRRRQRKHWKSMSEDMRRAQLAKMRAGRDYTRAAA